MNMFYNIDCKFQQMDIWIFKWMDRQPDEKSVRQF